MNESLHSFDPASAPLSGINIIEASAGTGKTFNIVRLYLRILLEKSTDRNVDASSVLVVTFTKAAARELSERIRKLLSEAQSILRHHGEHGTWGEQSDPTIVDILKSYPIKHCRSVVDQVLRMFDEVSIYTIHGFAYQILGERAFECGNSFQQDLISSQTDFIERISEDFWRRNVTSAHATVLNYLIMKKISPKLFVRFGELSLQHNNTKILPDHVKEPDEKRFEDYETLLNKYREIYKKSREEIRSSLVYSLQKEILNKKQFQPDKLEDLFSILDEATEGEHPFPSTIKFGTVTITEKLSSFYIENKAYRKSAKDPCPAHPFFDISEELHRASESIFRHIHTRILHWKITFFHELPEKLEEMKLKHGVIHYNDLLQNLNQALTHPVTGDSFVRSLREKYTAALIDEFQDTDNVQWEIFKTIFDSEQLSLFLIGDPKQSIYRFRGADIHAYINAKKYSRFRYTLYKNFRSAPGLLSGINDLFENVDPNENEDGPFLFSDIPYIPMESGIPGEQERDTLFLNGAEAHPLRILFLDSPKPLTAAEFEQSVLSHIAREIRSLLFVKNDPSSGKPILHIRKFNSTTGNQTHEPVKASHIAVLVRKHREAEAIQSALRNEGIPAIIRSDKTVFETQEALDLLKMLIAVERHGRPDLVKEAMATSVIGHTLKEILDENVFEQHSVLFYTLSDIRKTRSFMTFFHIMMDRFSIHEKLLRRNDGERIITNLNHLAELIHLQKQPNLVSEIRWLEKQIQERPREDGWEIRLESDDLAVQILTAHVSKGLEYPIVYIPFLRSFTTGSRLSDIVVRIPESNETALLPEDVVGVLENSDSSPFDDLDGALLEEYVKIDRKEQMAEELRLLYVALTRAKHMVRTAIGPTQDLDRSAFYYLLSGGTSLQVKYSKNDLPDVLRQDLKQFQEKVRHSWIMETIEKEIPHEERIEEKKSLPELKYNIFRGHTKPGFSLSSFTSLIHRTSEENPADHDGNISVRPVRSPFPISEKKPTPKKEKNQSFNIHNFPRGAAAGTFFHSLFENMDFTSDDNARREVIQKELKNRGYEKGFENELLEMINRVLSVPLIDGIANSSLNTVSYSDRMTEMGFYYPVNPVPSVDANSLRRLKIPEKDSIITRALTNHPRSPDPGWLSGFVDLVFRMNGQIYLLDWKSNYLGDSFQDYHREAVIQAMEKESYALQYFLYTIALNRFLQNRMEGYDYEKHFGGVYYLFIRGVMGVEDPSSGIYFHRPEKVTLDRLENIIIGERESVHDEA